MIYYLGNKFNDVKDKFDKLKFELNDKISKCEVLLEEKERIEPKNGKEVIKLKKIDDKINDLIIEIDKDINELEKEYKAQKNKSRKYENLETKEKIMELLKDKIKILKRKINGEEINEEDYSENKTALEQLDDLLKKKKDSGDGENSEGRELYDEEKNAMDEWKKKREEQDEQLDDLGKVIGDLGNEAIKVGQGIADINKKIKPLSVKIDGVGEKIKTQNERLSDLVNKIRKSDKICCDIILILIFLGLICVLYSIIKHKYK